MSFETAKAFHEHLSHGWCGDPSRGAAMGWSLTPKAVDTVPVKCRLFQVRLDSGGYDPQGYYYGLGQTLWECQPEDLPGQPEYDVEVANRGEIPREPFRFRAGNRREAMDVVRESYPNARFFRGTMAKRDLMGDQPFRGLYRGRQLFKQLEDVDNRRGVDAWWVEVRKAARLRGVLELTGFTGPEWNAMARAVNQGIDSHLEAVRLSSFNVFGITRLDPEDVPVIVRRLTERLAKTRDEAERQALKAVRTRIHRALASVQGAEEVTP